LRTTLAERAMIFNEVDQAPFRARMAPVYAAWREKLGSNAGPCSKATSET